jgi:hypothetical protein
MRIIPLCSNEQKTVVLHSKNYAENGVYLGSNAKSSPLQQSRGFQPITSVDKTTGEINQSKPEYCPVSVRLERFALQSSVRLLLPKSRTAKCLRLRQGEGIKRLGDCVGEYAQSRCKDLEVWRSREHGTAHYVGLQTCSSVWACPVCAAKISERRRFELLQAIEKHQEQGGQVLLLTLTNPHTRTDNLQDMLKAQALAMSRFTSIKASRSLRSSIGCIGTIRAYEVTHGVNGWHPHFHVLLFVSQGLDLEDCRYRFFEVWSSCCRLAGLPAPSFAHGVDLQDGTKAAQYVSKGLWGLDREMTKGHMKKAAKGGKSPFDLLRLYLNDRDKQSGALFVEYSTAFKGKRQLVWSKGLKELFSVEEQTDEETSARVEDDAYLLGKIEIEQWRAVLRVDARGEVLELARYGWDSVERFLVGLLITEKQRNEKQRNE